MTIRELQGLLAHAKHMVDVRPNGPDRMVAAAFVEFAEAKLNE